MLSSHTPALLQHSARRASLSASPVLLRAAKYSNTKTRLANTSADAGLLKTPTLSTRSPRTRTQNQVQTYTQTQTRGFQKSSVKMGVHNLASKKDFDAALSQDSSLVVLDCFAVWCGPCKIIAPEVVKFSEQYSSSRFYKLDVDQVPDVAQELGIRAMPTFLLFKDGEKIAEVVGANPKALEATISKHAA